MVLSRFRGYASKRNEAEGAVSLSRLVLDLVRAAKREGLPISCDVGAHHVHLTEMDIGFFDSNARVTPPFGGVALPTTTDPSAEIALP